MKLPKTWFTIAVFCLLAAIPYFLPSWDRFRILDLRRISAPFAAWRPGALDRIFLKPRSTLTANPTTTARQALRPRRAPPPTNRCLPPS